MIIANVLQKILTDYKDTLQHFIYKPRHVAPSLNLFAGPK